MNDTARAHPADAFFEMQQRILKNDESTFGGAFVIVPAEGAGEPLETLILDARPDPAQFWQMLLVKCQIMLGEIEAKSRANQAFGRR